MLSVEPGEIEVCPLPYPHVVLEGALRDYPAIEADFPAEDRFAGKIRMHGDLTEGDEEYACLIAESPAFRALHEWVYSEAFIRAFLTIFEEEIAVRVASGELIFDPRELPIRPAPFEGRQMLHAKSVVRTDPFLFPRLDLGIGRAGYGKVNGGGGIHVDNLTRLVSILIYIDDNPTMVGGEHRLYRLDGATPLIDKVLPPKPNLMIASLQSNVALHDVHPVTEITGVRKALYAAVSCSAEIWRPHSDRALQRLTKNRYRPTIPEKVARKARKWLSGS